MLDYEIEKYIVEKRSLGDCSSVTVSFGTEEEAIEYIRLHRAVWEEYKLTKLSRAIIDF